MRPTDMRAQWENIQHPAWIDSRRRENESFESCVLRLVEEYQLDIVSLVPEREVTFGNVPTPLRIHDPADIYAFDPLRPPKGERIDYVEALGVDPSASVDEMAECFHRRLCKHQAYLGTSALYPGAQWHQLIHYFSTTFGWEKTAIAACDNRRLFGEIMWRFASLTHKVLSAWAQTGVEVMICHDDLAMGDRTIFAPDWYREEVYPLYEYLWTPLRSAGIPILFFSDGKIDPLMHDIAGLGVAGFYLDDVVDFEWAASQFGHHHVLIGNISCRKLTFGDTQEIETDIQSCMMTGRRCTSHIVQCSGGILGNIPLARVDAYFDSVTRMRKESASASLRVSGTDAKSGAPTGRDD